MTHQFKFGDRVCHKQTGVEGLIIDANKTAAWIIWEGQRSANFYFYAYDEFEPVPHPDTVRLDWLADKHNKIGIVLLPTECVEKHLDSMRDAIDEAMRLTESDNPK